jgi:hypothetical protein
MTTCEPEAVDHVAQAIRIKNPIGAAQTAEVAVEALREYDNDRFRKCLKAEQGR